MYSTNLPDQKRLLLRDTNEYRLKASGQHTIRHSRPATTDHVNHPADNIKSNTEKEKLHSALPQLFHAGNKSSVLQLHSKVQSAAIHQKHGYQKKVKIPMRRKGYAGKTETNTSDIQAKKSSQFA